MKTQQVLDSLRTQQKTAGYELKGVSAPSNDELFEQFSQTLEKIVLRVSQQRAPEDQIMQGVELARMIEHPTAKPIITSNKNTLDNVIEDKGKQDNSAPHKQVTTDNPENQPQPNMDDTPSDCTSSEAPQDSSNCTDTEKSAQNEVETSNSEQDLQDPNQANIALATQHVVVTQSTQKESNEVPAEVSEGTDGELNEELVEQDANNTSDVVNDQNLSDTTDTLVDNEVDQSEISSTDLKEQLSTAPSLKDLDTQTKGQEKSTEKTPNLEQVPTAEQAQVTPNQTAEEALTQTVESEDTIGFDPSQAAPQNIIKVTDNINKNAINTVKSPQHAEQQEQLLETLISAALHRQLITPPTQRETPSLSKPSAAQALQLLNNGDSGAMRTANYAGSTRGDTPRAAVPKAQAKAAEARTMEKVENALKEVARSKDGKTISVRLEPSNLGEVKVDISLREGNLHARLSAETTQVSTMLKERAHEIVTMLRKLGLHVDKITVAVGSSEEQINTSSGSFQSYQSFERFEDKKQQGSNQQTLHKGMPMSGMSERINTLLTDHWIA